MCLETIDTSEDEIENVIINNKVQLSQKEQNITQPTSR